MVGHDEDDRRHQAMIITSTKHKADVCAAYINNNRDGNIAESFYAEKQNTNVKDRFDRGEIKILVVCGSLIEGYDNKNISVVGIIRNIQPKSKVLFTQFVGRCIRRYGQEDRLTSYVVSHCIYDQRENFNNMNELAVEHPNYRDEDQDAEDANENNIELAIAGLAIEDNIV